MRTIIMLASLVVCFASPTAFAFDLTSPSKNDKKLIALASMALIDYTQSVRMFYKMDGYLEYNPLLGSNPERENMLMFGLASLTIAYGINEIMPEGKLKDFLFDSLLATEKFNIEENKQSIETGKRSFEGITLIMTWGF